MEKPLRAYIGDEPYVFVCYSHEDSPIVYPDIEWLSQQGINVWYDEGIAAGKVWRAEIATAIRRAAKFLYYISPASLRSAHCNREIEYALDRELEVVPVYVNEAELPPQLDLALSRVQALRRSADTTYRRRLLEALGSVSTSGRSSPRPSPPSLRSKWPVLVLAIVMLAAGGWWYWSRAPHSDAADRSIVVLPFANLSNDPENEYLADGFSEELIVVLAKVPGLRLTGRTSSFYFKTHPADLTTIRDALNVRYAVEGSVRRNGDDLRVTANLIEIANGFELASLVFDRRVGDLLKLQSDVATAIVDAFAPQLTSAEVRLATAAGTANEQAFQLFLKAQHHMRRDNAADFALAEELYRAAIALDPHFYRAYSELFIAIGARGVRSADYQSAYERLKELDEQLLALDPEGPDLRRLRSFASAGPRNWPAAEALVRSELATKNNDPFWLARYAELLANAGLFAAAFDYRNLILQSDPFDPDSIEGAGNMLLALGRHDEALTAYERCLELEPARSGCYGQKAVTLTMMGRLDAARALFGDNPPRIYSCIWGELAVCRPYDLPDPAYNLVLAIGARDFDAAFEWANKAADQPIHVFADQFRWSSVWWPAKFLADSRYQQLLERLRLTDQWQAELCARARTLTPATGIAVACS